MGRASKDKRDIYYRKAKEEGYRARSAYKLLQIHEEFNILDPAEIRTGAVDLCAAPGSWSQVLAHHFRTLTQQNNNATVSASTSSSTIAATASAPQLPPPRVVAVDLQEMAPIEGVRILQGDITSEATANEIIRLLNAPETEEKKDPEKEESSRNNNSTSITAAAVLAPSSAPSTVDASPRKADIVICDGAPDVTGMHELDEYLQHHLLLAALHITTFILRPGGCFVTKMFRGPNTPFLVAKSEVFFEQVRVVKPKSSRNASMESFLLCQGFRLPPGYVPRFMDTPAPSPLVNEAEGANENEGGPNDGPLRASSFTPEAPVFHYSVAAEYPSPSAAAAAATNTTAPPVGSSARTACTLPSGVLAPFLSCGDLSGFDADMCYDRAADATVLPPVQPPLQAPYLSGAAATANRVVDKASTEVERKKAKVEASP